MDLRLYARVLARFWPVVLGGFALAVLLAVLAIAKPVSDGGLPSLVYRDPEVWQSQTTVLLTQPGFPEGRSTFPSITTSPKVSFADPVRFWGLAEVYAQLVSGDEVRVRLRRARAVPGTVSATALQSDSGNPTPLIAIFGKAGNPEDAVKLATQATSAFGAFIDDRQRNAGIPLGQRVVVQTIKGAEPPVLIAPRSKTLPIMVFLGVFSAAIAFAFVRENLRPQASGARVSEDVAPTAPTPAPAPAPEPAQASEGAVAGRWVSDRPKPRSSFLR